MPELKHTFQSGKMEKDIDERIVPNGQYREALNIGVATSEDSDVGAAQNILGNTKVTEAIQSRTWVAPISGPNNSSSNTGGNEHAGFNYHIASVVDQKTDMLYRFINTESVDQGVWMDRIVEYNTRSSYSAPWQTKEDAVIIDIYKVRDELLTAVEPCLDANKFSITIDINTNQVRWGMVISIPDRSLDTDVNVVVERVNYNTGLITLSKNITSYGVTAGDEIFFHGDRNLNFHKNRSITAINIIDGMLFWTDNHSEPKKVHIERGKMGSDGSLHASNPLLIGRGVEKIDNFNQHTLLIVEDIVPEDCMKDESFCGVIYGCTDPTAINYDPTATIDDGSCIATVVGCMCGGANNGIGQPDYYGVYNDCFGDGLPAIGFDPLANTPCDDTNGDGIPDCCTQTIYGCTDPLATNYDATATVDDGTCLYPNPIPGCTDPTACNYDPLANTDDGSCCYVCGCTNPLACNYNPLACHDDGSCNMTLGCTDPTACNYNPTACIDDNSCIPGGCTDPTACNYDASAGCDDGSCTYSDCTDTGASNYNAAAGCDCAGTVGGTDYSCCIYPPGGGCTDPFSCNYDPTATFDDGSCVGNLGCTDCGRLWEAGIQNATGNTCYCNDTLPWDGNSCSGDGSSAVDVNTGAPYDGSCYSSFPNTIINDCESNAFYVSATNASWCKSPGCADDGNQTWSPYPGIQADNYDPFLTSCECGDYNGDSVPDCCTYTVAYSCIIPGYETEHCSADNEMFPIGPNMMTPHVAFDPINYPNQPTGVVTWTNPPGAPPNTPGILYGHEELIINYWSNPSAMWGHQSVNWTNKWFWFDKIDSSLDCGLGFENDGICNYQIIDPNTGAATQCVSKKTVNTGQIGENMIGFYRTATANNSTGANVNDNGWVNPNDVHRNQSPVVFGPNEPDHIAAHNGQAYSMKDTWSNIITYLREVSIFDGNFYHFDCSAVYPCSGSTQNCTIVQVPEVNLSMTYVEVREIVESLYNFADWNVSQQEQKFGPGNGISCSNGAEFIWSYADCTCSGAYQDIHDCVFDVNGLYPSELDCNNANAPCDGHFGPDGHERETIYA